MTAGFDEDALELLKREFNRAIEPQLVCCRNDEDYYVVPDANGTPVLTKIPNNPPRNEHTLLTVDSFIQFCSVPTRNGLVMIGERSIVANMAYGLNRVDQAEFELKASEEFAALQQLIGVQQIGQKESPKPTGPKAIWRLLMTELNGCFPPELVAYMSMIDINTTKKVAVQIAPCGLVSGQASETIDLVMGESKTELPLDWTFTGRMVRGFEKTYELKIRLEIAADENRVLVTFHPVRLETLKDQVLADITDEIKTKLPASQWQVYAGTF